MIVLFLLGTRETFITFGTDIIYYFMCTSLCKHNLFCKVTEWRLETLTNSRFRIWT